MGKEIFLIVEIDIVHVHSPYEDEDFFIGDILNVGKTSSSRRDPYCAIYTRFDNKRTWISSVNKMNYIKRQRTTTVATNCLCSDNGKSFKWNNMLGYFLRVYRFIWNLFILSNVYHPRVCCLMLSARTSPISFPPVLLPQTYCIIRHIVFKRTLFDWLFAYGTDWPGTELSLDTSRVWWANDIRVGTCSRRTILHRRRAW